MIHKYLVAGNQIYFASLKQEIAEDKFRIVELLMPHTIFNNAQGQLQKFNYLRSSNAEAIQIKSASIALYKKIAPYAINEKDRLWLYQKAKGL